MVKKEKILSELRKKALIASSVGCVILLLFCLVKYHPGLNFVAGVTDVKGASTVSFTMPSQTPTPVPPSPTAREVNEIPAQYQNFGWYTHNGQSMQYVNGNWYGSPQQNATPTPKPQSTNSSYPSYTVESTRTCVLSYGTYQLTQAECDSAKQQDSNYVQCQTSTGIYLLTAQECTNAQQQDLQNTQNQAVAQQQQNTTLYNQCVSNAQNTYNQQQQNCMNQYGDSSAGPACVQIVQQQEQQAISNCGAEYPH